MKRISVFSRKFGPLDKKFALKALRNNWISSNGPFSKKLENFIKREFKTDYVSLVSSGTSALECALKAINLKKGDEVIVPAFTIVSCLNTILKFGAKPIIVDVKKETWLPSLDEILSKISKKTKAIIVVHIFGNVLNIPDLKKKISNKIKIIEDCAEAPFAKFKKKYVGTLGDLGTFSFYANKTITSGEGGMVITRNKNFHKIIEKYKNLYFGDKNLKRFDHEDIGFNFRMTDLQAAVAYSQAINAKKNILKMKKNVILYKKYLDKKSIEFQKIDNHVQNVWWMIAFVMKNKKSDDLIRFLNKKNIDSRKLFKPLNDLKYIKGKKQKCPNSKYLYDHGLYIPSGFDLTNNQIKRVSKACNEFFKKR
ncbi:DegT/DnrJ/EryC1/StrS family aminotransferase [Candidatus Pelagibacter communis]|uniref:DegT/DnrJ/EryC1/StrS family aminotransferase n=1 Tax=Pelagibacter ubique TaxID=198252 RepID=UPI00094C6798|nr:DegT/DnrJ/EryC1/StrS family aminotransferase [Candidatus Pelagibacter ubique]